MAGLGLGGAWCQRDEWSEAAESETVQTTKVRQPRLRVAPERREEGNSQQRPPTTTRSVAPLSPADTNVVHKRGKETLRVRERVVVGGSWTHRRCKQASGTEYSHRVTYYYLLDLL